MRCLLLAVPLAAACTDVTTNKTAVLSVQFDSLTFPSVAVGDTLRDSAGAVIHPHVTAYNFQGDLIDAPNIRFNTPDRGITVDSLTGIVVGDSLRTTAARVIATVAQVQAQQPVLLSLRPDLIVATNASDSIAWSLLDTTVNVTPTGVSVHLIHRNGADSAAPNWIVSFKIISSPPAGLVELVNDAGKASYIDTTDASGLAARKIKLHVGALGTSSTDSVIINATAKYRGTAVSGSPVRLVVTYKPRTP